MTTTVRVKICCIGSPEEARLAVRYGADALGLVGKMPSGPGVIPDATIRQIAAQVPPPVATFLLTSEVVPAEVAAHHRRTLTTAIQIVDAVDVSAYPILRKELPGVKIVQVVHVQGESALPWAIEVSQWVDAILLDSGRKDRQVKELGGTGRVHDWKISRKIRDVVGVPVFLAGGITPENAAQAVSAVEPFGLDICSGVRTEGKLDEAKLSRLFAALRSPAT
ncbi:MAG: phosphoribosylanthranilate isomerase [Bacteroidota bacterium]